MRGLAGWMAAGLLVLGVARASAGDEPSLPDRVAALEAEAKRLLAEVDALKGRLPQEAMIRAEIAARYRTEVGEAVPTDVLDREAGAVLGQLRQLLDAGARRAVEAGRKLPLTAPLAGPLVILQVRSGAGGGNPNTVDMLGRLSNYVDERSRAPIPWSASVQMSERSRAYVLGGSIPEGKAFAVTKVTWKAVAAGDSNGPGEYVVRLGAETIGHDRDNGSTYSGTWQGRVVIHRGDEAKLQVQVANSSAVEARYEGELVDEAGK